MKQLTSRLDRTGATTAGRARCRDTEWLPWSNDAPHEGECRLPFNRGGENSVIYATPVRMNADRLGAESSS
jgi:hypothetical protein